MTIAERLFELDFVKSDLEEVLYEQDVPYDDLGWDHYDASLELLGMPKDYRLTEKAAGAIYDAGFSKIYLNHVDKWETHYSKCNPNGWRVSYPYKRGEGEAGIWVEEIVSGWPKEWFETGYAAVKKENNDTPAT